MSKRNGRGIRPAMVCWLLIVSAAVLVVPAEADTHWSAAEVVSTESDQNSSEVSMAVDNVGNVHLAWSDNADLGGSGSDSDIFYKNRLTDGSWTTVEVVSTESTQESSEPSIAVDVSGRVYIAWSETDTDEIHFKMKTSSGTWTQAVIASQPSSGDFDSLKPTLAVDSSGNAHLAWEFWEFPESNIHYRKRSSNGAWAPIENLSSGTYGGWAPHLLVDHEDTVHLVYVMNYWAGIVYYQSLVSDGNWSSPEDASGAGEFSIDRTQLAVDRDDGLHVVWDDLDEPNGLGLLYNNKPSPGTWGMNRFLTRADWYSNFSLAATPDGQLHLAWHADDAGIYDIYCMRKDGDSWMPPSLLTPGFTENSLKPNLVADDLGSIHVAWSSSSDHLGSGPDSDIFYMQNPAPSGTVSAGLSCVPGSGTVPFTTNITASLTNTYSRFKRRIAARMDLDLGNGQHWNNWRVGYTQLDPGESYVRSWNQQIPALVTVLGSNVFSLSVEDVTPPPYNQPPYAAAGDTDLDSCSVQAVAP